MSTGQTLAGRYRLDAVVGEGGMGIVWRAYDLRLDRLVAVKEVRLGAGLTNAEAAELTARAVAEGRRSSRLIHPHIVTIFDVIDDGDKPWLIMQLVEGRSLHDVVGLEGRLPVPRVARIGAQVLSGLIAAHGMGIVHRDVKPANILIARDGQALLSDFSIAKSLRQGIAGPTTSTMVGSPGFVAPELLLTGRVGAEGDLFGLGACLFEAVEGYGAFARDEPIAGLFASASGPHPAPRYAAAMAPVIEGLLVKDPTQRMRADVALAALSVIADSGTVPTLTGVASPSAATLVRPRRVPAPPTADGGRGSDPSRRRRRRPAYAAILAILAATGLIAWLVPRLNTGPLVQSALSPSVSPGTPLSVTPTAAPGSTASAAPVVRSTAASHVSSSPVKVCTDAEIKVTVTIESISAADPKLRYGGTFGITMRISSVSNRDCTRDVGSVPEEMTIKQGGKTVWASGNCGQAIGADHDVRTFHPGDVITSHANWNSYQREPNECVNSALPAPTGTYQATGRVGTDTSAPVTFDIVS